MRRLTFDDLIEPPIVAAVWVAVSWLWARGVNGTFKLDRLTPFQKLVTLYGGWFFLGMSFLLNLAGALRLSDSYWIGFVAGWAVILAGIAYWRRRKGFRKFGGHADTP